MESLNGILASGRATLSEKKGYTDNLVEIYEVFFLWKRLREWEREEKKKTLSEGLNELQEHFHLGDKCEWKNNKWLPAFLENDWCPLSILEAIW